MIAAVQSSQTAAQQPAAPAAPGGALGQDAFMKLLVAQLRHQDPLNPSDGTAMATQLAQFSSLEQLVDIGNILRAQSAESSGLSAAIDRSTALAMVGKTAVVDSDEIVAGDGATPWVSATVEGSGGSLSLRLVDDAGKTVATHDFGAVGAGPLRVPLDAITRGLPAGRYRVEFDFSSGKATTHPAASVPVTIDGIGFQDGTLVFTSGDRTYPLTAVRSVTAHP
ncbi:MAG: hypothetical protein IT356_06210 [Gemmatimonadaceae bacterium]|nr:hypothetical protein [Gemmatimonadaceae bacterium]